MELVTLLQALAIILIGGIIGGIIGALPIICVKILIYWLEGGR